MLEFELSEKHHKKTIDALESKIESFRKLEDDWDGNGSVAPSNETIDRSLVYIKKINKYPSRIICSVNGTIILEFDINEIVEIE